MPIVAGNGFSDIQEMPDGGISIAMCPNGLERQVGIADGKRAINNIREDCRGVRLGHKGESVFQPHKAHKRFAPGHAERCAGYGNSRANPFEEREDFRAKLAFAQHEPFSAQAFW